MSWTCIPPTPERPFIEYVFEEPLTGDDVVASIHEGAAVAKQHGVWRSLSDYSTIHTVEALQDLNLMSTTLADMDTATRQSPVAIDFRSAGVLPVDPEAAREALTIDRRAREHGLPVRFFADREEAVAWLMSD